ncbi:MAG: hypothetical protein JWP73_352 [Phenylobacterium sp.]|nr:hypothetical protein [Phenylobacterium sp.]
MNIPLKFAMASTLALATAAPAMAQYQPSPYQPNQYPPNQYQPTPQYQEDQQRYQQQRDEYQQQRDAYDARRSDYDQHRQGYQAARNEYQRRLDAYNRARYDYDRRYGRGAYVRVYGPAPVWSDSNWAYYVTPAPSPYYAQTPYAPAAPYYGANTAYAAPVQCDHSSTVPAGAIGALAGALLGSNVAARGRRTEGAVLGGVVGAGVGAAVGHAHDKYKCDQRGPYFGYNETIPYRESSDYRTDRYSDYQRMGCRLATAPVDSYGQDYRYVRVCPDPDGRYRIVG